MLLQAGGDTMRRSKLHLVDHADSGLDASHPWAVQLL